MKVNGIFFEGAMQIYKVCYAKIGVFFSLTSIVLNTRGVNFEIKICRTKQTSINNAKTRPKADHVDL